MQRYRILCIATSLLFVTSSCSRRASEELTAAPKTILNDLPQDLRSLQSKSGFLAWEPVSVFSRSLGHFRQVRFDESSNIAISETGNELGKVDVVEVILVPLDTTADAQFALYDPKSGEKIDRYPDAVKFDIEGMPEGSKTPVPSICLACHHANTPLTEVVVWTEPLGDTIAQARANGHGIRQLLVDPADGTETRAIEDLNEKMRRSLPGRVFEIRRWLNQLQALNDAS